MDILLERTYTLAENEYFDLLINLRINHESANKKCTLTIHSLH